MNTTLTLSDRVRTALRPTGTGVIGVVDQLLGLCREHALHLKWDEDQCRVRQLTSDPAESVDVPMRKSFFRAILARVAALCNERVPNSVSPYGGVGELTSNSEQPTHFRAVFTNTLDEQRLEVRRVG